MFIVGPCSPCHLRRVYLYKPFNFNLHKSVNILVCNAPMIDKFCCDLKGTKVDAVHNFDLSRSVFHRLAGPRVDLARHDGTSVGTSEPIEDMTLVHFMAAQF